MHSCVPSLSLPHLLLLAATVHIQLPIPMTKLNFEFIVRLYERTAEATAKWADIRYFFDSEPVKVSKATLKLRRQLVVPVSRRSPSAGMRLEASI